MSEKKQPKKKAIIIKNGRSPLALQKLVSALISDVTYEPEIIPVGKSKAVKIIDERWEIFWRTKKGAQSSLKKAITIAEAIEDTLTDANIVATKVKGIQGQCKVELFESSSEEETCRCIGWFQNKKKNFVPVLLISRKFVGEKKIFFGKGFSFTVFVK